MKKIILSLAVALSMSLSGTAARTLAQKSDPGPVAPGEDVAGVVADLDPYLDKLAADVAAFQSEFIKSNRGYAQTLSPFAVVPSDGKAELPADLTKTPTDGVSADTLWQAAALDAFPADWHIDVYDGPQGKGYVIVSQVKFNSQLYQRSINVGPEEYRDQDWIVVP